MSDYDNEYEKFEITTPDKNLFSELKASFSRYNILAHDNRNFRCNFAKKWHKDYFTCHKTKCDNYGSIECNILSKNIARGKRNTKCNLACYIVEEDEKDNLKLYISICKCCCTEKANIKPYLDYLKDKFGNKDC